MPAYPLSQLQSMLSKYIMPDEEFIDVMNQVMPRVYETGYWRDLVKDVTVSTDHNYFALPEGSESLLAVTVDGDAKEERSIWADFRITGTHEVNGNIGIYGVVDDGYHAVKIDLDPEEKYQLAIKPSRAATTLPSSGTVTISYSRFDGSEGSEVLTMDGSDVVYTTDKDINYVDSIVFNVGGENVILTSLLQGEAPEAGQQYQIVLELNPTEYYPVNNIITGDDAFTIQSKIQTVLGINDTVLVSDYNADGTYDENTSFLISLINFNGNDIQPLIITVVDGVAGGLTDGEVTSEFIEATKQTLALNKTVETNLAEANIGMVSRYRRFRINNPEGLNKNVRMLVKRSFKPYESYDDIEYLGNVNAIKHGLLAKLSADASDFERAEYHWDACKKRLEDEVDSNRGSIRKKITIDPLGGAGYPTRNMI